MAIMFGNGSIDTTAMTNISHVERFIAKDNVASTEMASTAKLASAGIETVYQYQNGEKTIAKANISVWAANGGSTTACDSIASGSEYFYSYTLPINGGLITVSADTFPGTYYVTGDTYARSENSGEDEFFQFIIPKAKVTAENTITLEAEGDPAVFNLNLTVLRPKDGVMMKLVKYDIDNE